MSNDAMTGDTPFAKNYAREVLTISHGSGVWLRDTSGRRYLDFGSGIAVNALGYGDRRLARVVARQMKQLVGHRSREFTSETAVPRQTRPR